MVFASRVPALAVNFGHTSVTGATTMSIARPIHVLIVFAAFLFIGGIVLGAF